MRVGFDLGFGWAKVCSEDNRCMKFPTWLAYFSESAISDMEVVSYDGKDYVVGEDAKYERQKIVIADINDLLHYFNVFKKYALSKLDIEDDVEIITGLPPIHKDKAGILEKQGITVLPQGVGIWLDVKDKLKSQEVLIIDIGFNTVDYIMVVKGIKKKGNTLEKQGVERMVELFRNKLDIPFVKQFPLQRLMEVFENGYINIEGEKVDLSNIKQKAVDEYNELLKTRLKSEIGNLIDEIESIAVAGGGAYYIKGIRKDAFIPENPEFSQARGYTRA